METNKLTYLVVENAPDVCEGIIRRMNNFEKWQSLGYCVGVKEAIEKIRNEKPHLLYLDWGLNGGSAFEVLQEVQNISGYDPYIIFNTGFQKDNPEIPQEIINKYRVDKYLIKPLWENLRINLPVYLKEAEQKICLPENSSTMYWIEDTNKNKLRIDMNKIMCIAQHPVESRNRNFYLYGNDKEITTSMQWQRCYELLNQFGVDFFITKNRSHLVAKKYIEKFEKPYIRLRGLKSFKIDVVKENIKLFEEWLLVK